MDQNTTVMLPTIEELEEFVGNVVEILFSDTGKMHGKLIKNGSGNRRGFFILVRKDKEPYHFRGHNVQRIKVI